MPDKDAIKGPWTAERTARKSFIIWDSEGFVVADLAPGNDREGWEERLQAIATLIGAAPELLDLLERSKFFCKGSKLGEKIRKEINDLLERMKP